MKINFKSYLWLAFVGLIGFSSCSSDEETPAPTLTITSSTISLGDNPTGGDADSGAVVTVTLTAKASEGIAEINVTKTYSGTETSLTNYPKTKDFTSSTEHNWNLVYTVDEPSGSVVLKFSVKDKKGKIFSKNFTINIKPKSTISSYQTVLMNNQESSNQKSFYSVTTNQVFQDISSAKTNSSKVDFIHILRNSTNGGRKIVAPNSQDATDIYGNANANPAAVTTWATRNATKFKSITLTQAEFNAIATPSALTGLVGAASTLTIDNIGSLNSGSAFAFLLANGKRGIAIVSSVTGPDAFASGSNNEGSITLSVKVEN